MSQDKQNSANFLLNTIAELEPRPTVRQALIAVTQEHLKVLLSPDAPAAPAPAVVEPGNGG